MWIQGGLKTWGLLCSPATTELCLDLFPSFSGYTTSIAWGTVCHGVCPLYARRAVCAKHPYMCISVHVSGWVNW